MFERIHAEDPDALTRAGEVIKRGGIIVYPTDTLYGLGVNATDSTAVKILNLIKGRRGPISVIAADNNMVRKWTALNTEKFQMAAEKLGGPTTVIMPVKKDVTVPEIMGNNGSLGIRIPSHPFGPNLVQKLGFPVTTTSVNRSGETPLNNPDEISEKFENEIDLLVDGGTLPPSHGSKIYKLENNSLTLIRS